MPDKPAAQLIREYAEQIAKIGERVDLSKMNLDRVEGRLIDLEKRIQDLDKQAALSTRDLDGLVKRVAESHSRRYEFVKLIVAALLGGIVTPLINAAIRFLQTGPPRSLP